MSKEVSKKTSRAKGPSVSNRRRLERLLRQLLSTELAFPGSAMLSPSHHAVPPYRRVVE